MLFIIFQDGMFPLMPLLVLIPIFIITEILLLKIGLLIVKARERKSMHWVIISVFTQIGAIFLTFLPLLMFGIAGEITGSNIAAIILMSLLAILIDFNLINVLHRLGIKRSLIVFLFFAIPLIIFGNLFGFLIGSLL